MTRLLNTRVVNMSSKNAGAGLNICVVNMSSKNAGAGVASESVDNELPDDASIEYDTSQVYMCSKYELSIRVVNMCSKYE